MRTNHQQIPLRSSQPTLQASPIRPIPPAQSPASQSPKIQNRIKPILSSTNPPPQRKPRCPPPTAHPTTPPTTPLLQKERDILQNLKARRTIGLRSVILRREDAFRIESLSGNLVRSFPLRSSNFLFFKACIGSETLSFGPLVLGFGTWKTVIVYKDGTDNNRRQSQRI